jgi:hypothetical protein
MRSRFRQGCRMVVEGQGTKTRLLINYIIEKDKPLVNPV